MDSELIKLLIEQGEALMRWRCRTDEESDILKLIVKQPDNGELWKMWQRVNQRAKNAHRRLDAITNKIKQLKNKQSLNK